MARPLPAPPTWSFLAVQYVGPRLEAAMSRRLAMARAGPVRTTPFARMGSAAARRLAYATSVRRAVDRAPHAQRMASFNPMPATVAHLLVRAISQSNARVRARLAPQTRCVRAVTFAER